MTSQRAAKLLVELASPQGPWPTDYQRDLRQELMQGDPLVAAMAILEALATRPSLLYPSSHEDMDYRASDVLAELAKQQPSVRDYLINLLDEPHHLEVILDALADLADPAAAPALAVMAEQQVRQPSLSHAELLSLASALGLVDGPDALKAVELMRSRPWPPEVERELDIALQYIHAAQGE